MCSGALHPIYKHKHQSNSYEMGLMPIIVKVKIRDITLGLITHRKFDVIYESGQIFDVISHFFFNGIDSNSHPWCSIT